MFRYKGGNEVGRGFYWNPKAWAIEMVNAERGVLPGTPDIAYARVPVVALLLLAPFMGLAYAIFLPFIGFALLGDYLVRKAAAAVREAVAATTDLLSGAWRPGEAYLARRRRARKPAEPEAKRSATREP